MVLISVKDRKPLLYRLLLKMEDNDMKKTLMKKMMAGAMAFGIVTTSVFGNISPFTDGLVYATETGTAYATMNVGETTEFEMTAAKRITVTNLQQTVQMRSTHLPLIIMVLPKLKWQCVSIADRN